MIPDSAAHVVSLEARLRAVSKKEDALNIKIAARSGKVSKALQAEREAIALELHDVTSEILELVPTVRNMKAKALVLSLAFGLDLFDHDSGSAQSYEDRVVLVIARDLMSMR